MCDWYATGFPSGGRSLECNPSVLECCAFVLLYFSHSCARRPPIQVDARMGSLVAAPAYCFGDENQESTRLTGDSWSRERLERPSVGRLLHVAAALGVPAECAGGRRESDFGTLDDSCSLLQTCLWNVLLTKRGLINKLRCHQLAVSRTDPGYHGTLKDN